MAEGTAATPPQPTSVSQGKRRPAISGWRPLLTLVVIGIIWLATRPLRHPPVPPELLLTDVRPRLSTFVPQFDGLRAFEHVRRQVALGPRPVGSKAHDATQAYILEQLTELGLTPTVQRFKATTPSGVIPMANILATMPASSPGSQSGPIVLAAHYDTKIFKEFNFVGANDGASGVAVLLELARVLQKESRRQPLVLAFLDGEEALVQFSPTDGYYGSRYLARAWDEEGRLQSIQAFILVDMVGFKHLWIVNEHFSTAWLKNRVWLAAQQLGTLSHFQRDGEKWVGDDHLAFKLKHVPVVDLIDFENGPQGFTQYWHTEEDVIDKISDASLQISGRIVETVLGNWPR